MRTRGRQDLLLSWSAYVGGGREGGPRGFGLFSINCVLDDGVPLIEMLYCATVEEEEPPAFVYHCVRLQLQAQREDFCRNSDQLLPRRKYSISETS